MCFVWVSEQLATAVPCKINCLVFIIEMEIVFCAARVQYRVIQNDGLN